MKTETVEVKTRADKALTDLIASCYAGTAEHPDAIQKKAERYYNAPLAPIYIGFALAMLGLIFAGVLFVLRMTMNNPETFNYRNWEISLWASLVATGVGGIIYYSSTRRDRSLREEVDYDHLRLFREIEQLFKQACEVHGDHLEFYSVVQLAAALEVEALRTARIIAQSDFKGVGQLIEDIQQPNRDYLKLIVGIIIRLGLMGTCRIPVGKGSKPFQDRANWLYHVLYNQMVKVS